MKQQAPLPDGLLTVEQACRYLGIASRNTLFRFRDPNRPNQLVTTRIGGRIGFRRSDLEQFIEMEQALKSA